MLKIPMDYKINILNNFNNKTNWDIPEIMSAFSCYRLLLEEHNLKSSFQFLNFFGNWSLHHQLTQSPIGFEILEEFSKISVDTFRVALVTQPEYFDRVKNAFSLDRLKTEMHSFNALLKVSGILLKQPIYFNGMCELLLFTLIDREVRFTQDTIDGRKNHAVYTRILNYAAQHNKSHYSAFSFKLIRSPLNPMKLAFQVTLLGVDGGGLNLKYLIPYVPLHTSKYV
jgi:hypothetical protein